MLSLLEDRSMRQFMFLQ